MEEVYNNNLQEIETKWTEKIDKINEKANLTEEKLIEKQEKEIESYQHDYESRLPKPSNNNCEINNLKKVMDMLVRQRK